MISNLREDKQHKHSNGGGWVADTARVEDSVHVGPHALVYGHAELSGRVVIVDSAQVSGKVQLSGDVIVRANCWLDGNFKANTGVFYKNERTIERQERIR